MKSTDLAKRWTVIKNTKNNMRCYFYGSYKEFLEEDCEENERHLWEEVGFNNWTSCDLVEISENELENANEHRWGWLPKTLLANLIINDIEESKQFDIILGIYMDWLTY